MAWPTRELAAPKAVRCGFGRELGEKGLDPYLEHKTVTVSLG